MLVAFTYYADFSLPISEQPGNLRIEHCTIQNADQIVVLEKGHIVDQGTQAELLRRCPLYQKLWQAHIGAQGWAVTSGAKEGQ